MVERTHPDDKNPPAPGVEPKQGDNAAELPASAGDNYAGGLIGRTTIAPDVLVNIARLTTLAVTGVSRMSPVVGRVDRLFSRGYNEGVQIDVKEDKVTVDLYVVLKDNVNIRDVCRTVQQEVALAISEMVGMQVGRINVHVEDIDYPVEQEV